MKKIQILALVAVMVSAVSAIAHQTAGEKANETARDAKVSTKKHYRRTKKKARDATGNHSTTEDVKDSAKNAGDSMDNAAKTAKDKAD